MLVYFEAPQTNDHVVVLTVQAESEGPDGAESLGMFDVAVYLSRRS